MKAKVTAGYVAALGVVAAGALVFPMAASAISGEEAPISEVAQTETLVGEATNPDPIIDESIDDEQVAEEAPSKVSDVDTLLAEFAADDWVNPDFDYEIHISDDGKRILFSSTVEGVSYYSGKLSDNQLKDLVVFSGDLVPVVALPTNLFTDGPLAGQVNPALSDSSILDRVLADFVRLKDDNQIRVFGDVLVDYSHGVLHVGVLSTDLDRLNELLAGTEMEAHVRLAIWIQVS